MIDGGIVEKSYFRIREVSEMLDESQTTLRFWEKEFREIDPMRSPKGVRYYTGKDIEMLRMIKFLLRDKGLKIDSAKEQLLRNRKNIANRIKVLTELQELKSELENLMSALKLRG